MRKAQRWSQIVAGLAVAWAVTAIPMPAHAIYQLIAEIPVSATAANPFNTNGQLNGSYAGIWVTP